MADSQSTPNTSSCGAARFSDETQVKHEQLGGLFKMLAKVLDSICRRHGKEFVYVDLTAGPGRYDHGALGSPLLASFAFGDKAWCSALHCFERDGETYERLTEAVAAHPKVIAHWQDHNDGFGAVVAQHPWQTYGLVFADANPGIDNIPLGVLKQAATSWPKVDILCYVSAAVVKRIRTTIGCPSLSEQLRSVGKAHCLIRRPHGRHQWTFALLTNWREFPIWKRAGFITLDSPEGQSVLQALDLTKREFTQQTQRDLFGDDE